MFWAINIKPSKAEGLPSDREGASAIIRKCSECEGNKEEEEEEGEEMAFSSTGLGIER